MLRAAILLAIVFLAPQAMAAARFSCGGADVIFNVLPAAPAAPGSALLGIRRGAQMLSLDLRGDFVGGECVADDRGRRMIVYQAYCGDPGCKEFANWGIVDPFTLRELLVPSDTNRDTALRLIGWALPRQINEVISVRTGRIVQIRPPKTPKKRR